MSTILPGWTSAATAGDGSPVRNIPPINSIDKEADKFPLLDPSDEIGKPGLNTPIAPPSGAADRDWTGGGGRPVTERPQGRRGKKIMAVAAKGNDPAGAGIDAEITTTAAALAAAPAASVQAVALATALDDAQRRAVDHYLQVGRLQASSIISALSLVAPKVPGNPGGIDLSNITNRLVNLATRAATASPSQASDAQALAQAQTELVDQCLAAKTVLPSQILAAAL